jgi:hypothetical protein
VRRPEALGRLSPGREVPGRRDSASATARSRQPAARSWQDKRATYAREPESEHLMSDLTDVDFADELSRERLLTDAANDLNDAADDLRSIRLSAKTTAIMIAMILVVILAGTFFACLQINRVANTVDSPAPTCLSLTQTSASC